MAHNERWVMSAAKCSMCSLVLQPLGTACNLWLFVGGHVMEYPYLSKCQQNTCIDLN